MDSRAGTNGRILTVSYARPNGADQVLIRLSGLPYGWAGSGQGQKEKGQAEAMLTAAFYPPRQLSIYEYGLNFPTEYKPGPEKEPGL